MMLSRFKRTYNRRPVPRNYKSLKCMRVSYSQFAEDLMVSNILGYNKSKGYYVDIGCNHPINYSNTYIFYQRGFHGVCIDPNSNYEKDWQRYRPRDLFKQFAVGIDEGNLSYLEYEGFPECNRIVNDKELTELNKKGVHPKYTKRKIKLKRLTDILNNIKWLPKSFDYLTIDCEHLDLEVLRSNDFNFYRPKVISIEDLDFDDNCSEIFTYLTELGYKKVGQFGLSKIFTDENIQF